MSEQTGAPPAAQLPQGQGDDAQRKKKKKKDKVRSAWISFVGRIVAQVVGAVATIVLGVTFMPRPHRRRDQASSSHARLR